MTVYVCAERDIECGDRAEGWCSTCPKRGPQPVAWVCTKRIKPDELLPEPFFASNPAYVKAHPNHNWTPLYALALSGQVRAETAPVASATAASEAGKPDVHES